MSTTTAGKKSRRIYANLWAWSSLGGAIIINDFNFLSFCLSVFLIFLQWTYTTYLYKRYGRRKYSYKPGTRRWNSGTTQSWQHNAPSAWWPKAAHKGQVRPEAPPGRKKVDLTWSPSPAVSPPWPLVSHLLWPPFMTDGWMESDLTHSNTDRGWPSLRLVTLWLGFQLVPS